MILLDIMNKPDEQKRGINIHPYVLIYKTHPREAVQIPCIASFCLCLQ